MEEKKLIRLKDVEKAVGLKKSFIYQMVKEGKFPQPFKLGPRAVAWRRDEIDGWIEGLARAKF